MATLSLCMIVKNEADVLARCLDCVRDIVDEINIVDTGSTDGTVEVAKQYTDRIFHFDWIQDFAAARNHSFSTATMDYVMWLDADDVIDEENRTALQALKAELDGTVDMVMLKYDVAFDEYDHPTLSYYRERICRRTCGYTWVGEVHEVIVPSGRVIHKDIAIQHRKTHAGDPIRNLNIYRRMIAEGKTLDPRQQFYYGRELYYNHAYDEAIDVLSGFLDSGMGWVENNIDACADLSNCYAEIGDHDAALQALFLSFAYAAPRAEICCKIGGHFMERQQYHIAIFWYDLALSSERGDTDGGFCSPDCYGYLPCIQMCVCYDRLGDRAKARAYNERAGTYKPQDASYLHNKQYFEHIS